MRSPTAKDFDKIAPILNHDVKATFSMWLFPTVSSRSIRAYFPGAVQPWAPHGLLLHDDLRSTMVRTFQGWHKINLSWMYKVKLRVQNLHMRSTMPGCILQTLQGWLRRVGVGLRARVGKFEYFWRAGVGVGWFLESELDFEPKSVKSSIIAELVSELVNYEKPESDSANFQQIGLFG